MIFVLFTNLYLLLKCYGGCAMSMESNYQLHHASSFYSNSKFSDGSPADARFHRSFSWMHIQKTSSWLQHFLLAWGCSQVSTALHHHILQWKQQHRNAEFSQRSSAVFDNSFLQRYMEHNMSQCEVTFLHTKRFGFHKPYNKWEMNGTVLTILRNPLDRVISAFLFAEGGMLPLGMPNRTGILSSKVSEKVLNAKVPVAEYAALQGISSCQTKMVLGCNCGVPGVNITDANIAEAKRRLRHDFVFVGLTEESAASGHLFIAMFGNGSLHGFNNFEHGSIRVNTQHSSDYHNSLGCDLVLNGWTDIPDIELHNEAQKIFYERCEQYGIATKLKYLSVFDEIQQRRSRCQDNI